MTDPTAFDLASLGDFTDPRVRRINGVTAHGNHRLDMPFISEIAHNLWQGGFEEDLVLPEFFEHVVSLYQWGTYEADHELRSVTTVRMYDSVKQGVDDIPALAQWVNHLRKSGPVLVHCQAGLNRSALVVASALVQSGEVAGGAEAIALLREKRSPAVLCNPVFERWVKGL